MTQTDEGITHTLGQTTTTHTQRNRDKAQKTTEGERVAIPPQAKKERESSKSQLSIAIPLLSILLSPSLL